jgi:hypothetical protein
VSAAERSRLGNDTGVRSNENDVSAAPEPAPAEQEETEAPPDTTTPASVIYHGTLADSGKTPFGGSGTCKYEITLKDIAIELDVLPSGDISTGSVTDTAVERVVECTLKAMGPQKQSFELTKKNQRSDGWQLIFTGAASNQPKTALAVELVKKQGGYDATMTWTRTDLSGPLAWTVTANLPVNAPD